MIFVGQSYASASDLRGISILLSAAPALDQDLSQLIQVQDNTGRLIRRDWLPSRNPRSLYMPGLSAGRYYVTLLPSLRDSAGKKLGIRLEGPVTIQ